MYQTSGSTRLHTTPSLYSKDLDESGDSSRWDDKENRNEASRWRQPKQKPQNKELTEEGKLAYRQKQIDFGKNTIGYDNYIRAVPKHKRDKRKPKLHPRTPDKRVENMSTKRFASHLRTWRKALHQYDDWSPQSKAPMRTSAKQLLPEHTPESNLGPARSEPCTLPSTNEERSDAKCTRNDMLTTTNSAEVDCCDSDGEDLEIVPMCMLPDLENMDEDGNLIDTADEPTGAKHQGKDSGNTPNIEKEAGGIQNDSSCIFTSDSFYIEGLEDIY